MARVRQKDPDRYTVCFFSDQHFPHEHTPSIETSLSFVRATQPDYIGLLGDLGDWGSPSKYVKHPREAMATQECIDASKNYLKRLRQAAPEAVIDYRLGNHEDRWNIYLMNNPVITELAVLDFSLLLGLHELDINLIPYKATNILHGLSIEHGHKVNSQSAYTAANMLRTRGMSGISGHTHRLGIHYKTDMAGTRFWIENGCMCDLSPSYANGQPDWQHGFTAGYWSHRYHRWFLNLYPMENGLLLTDETAFYWAER